MKNAVNAAFPPRGDRGISILPGLMLMLADRDSVSTGSEQL